MALLAAGVMALGAVAAVQASANEKLRLANDAKDVALAQSEQSRQQAEAVSTFLVDAFRSPDPWETGRDVKLADVLDRATDKLDKEFAGSRTTKGQLLNTLGTTYQGLGLYDKAAILHMKAASEREAAFGPDHPDTLGSRNNVAIDYYIGGRLAEAVALFEVTLRQMEAKLGADHRFTLNCRNNLASAYERAGRTSEAIALHETTLKHREAKLGPDHPDTLGSRNNLANAYKDAGRLNEAIALYEATLKLQEAKLGPDHPDTLGSRNNLANAYQNSGRPDTAIALHQATLELREGKLGPGHPETLESRINLASAYQDAGRLFEAFALNEETLKRCEAKLGPDHPSTIVTRVNLANGYRLAGLLSQATPLLEALLKLMAAKLGSDHFYTLTIQADLADVYASLGHRSEAEGLLRDVLVRRRKTVKPDSPLLAGDLAALGGNLLHHERWSEAEPLLREGLAIQARAASDAWEHYDTLSLLGGALLGQRRYAEAEPLVVSGYEGMAARAARIPAPVKPRLLAAAERVVRLYQDSGECRAGGAMEAKARNARSARRCLRQTLRGLWAVVGANRPPTDGNGDTGRFGRRMIGAARPP